MTRVGRELALAPQGLADGQQRARRIDPAADRGQHERPEAAGQEHDRELREGPLLGSAVANNLDHVRPVREVERLAERPDRVVAESNFAHHLGLGRPRGRLAVGIRHAPESRRGADD